MDIRIIQSKIRELANKKNAEVAQRFFKTGPGEYGEGDRFLGIRKRNLPSEEEFLKKHYKEMPRTMLRYAIERFPEAKRQRYLKGKI